MKKAVGVVLLVALLAPSVVLAGGQSEQDEGQERIAGVMMAADIEWFRYIDAGMRAAAEEEGVSYVTGNAEMDVVQEGNLIDTYTAQQYDAIIVSALDSSASLPAINRAKESGVTIINYNTMPPGSEYFIGIDNYQLGYQMGEYLADYIEREGVQDPKIALVTISMFEVGIQRRDGFVDAISRIDGIEFVAEQDAAEPTAGADVVETILQANPDLDFIWAANEGGAIGAVVGVSSAGRDEVLVFGTDMSLQAAQYLLDESSPLYAVSTQQPYQIGYQALKTAVSVLRGESVGAEVIVPLDLYSKDDVERVQGYLAEAESIVN